jgi:RNA polymerase sigma factor (sigma-70 family)
MQIDRSARELGNYQVLWTMGSAAGVSDGELLKQLAEGNLAEEFVLTVLISRHRTAVLEACRRALADCHDAEDAAQATFLILIRKARSLRIDDSAGPWLVGVARRVAARSRADSARARRREAATARNVQFSPPDLGLSELRGIVDEEVARLPARHGEAVALCCFEDLTYEEAAARLGCPSGTIKSRLARARRRLRERLTYRGLASWLAVIVTARSAQAGPLFRARSSTRFAPTGVVGERALSLAQSVLKEMAMTRLKVAAAVALGFGLWAVAAIARQEPGNGSLVRGMSRMQVEARLDKGRAEDDDLAILKVEREWRDAIVKRDMVALANFMADDYIATDTGGHTRDKNQTLAAHRSGDYSAQSYEALETKVRVYGTTAVVNGRSRWKAGDSQDLKITSVYVKRGGTWRCVTWHGSVVER